MYQHHGKLVGTHLARLGNRNLPNLLAYPGGVSSVPSESGATLPELAQLHQEGTHAQRQTVTVNENGGCLARTTPQPPVRSKNDRYKYTTMHQREPGAVFA